MTRRLCGSRGIYVLCVTHWGDTTVCASYAGGVATRANARGRIARAYIACMGIYLHRGADSHGVLCQRTAGSCCTEHREHRVQNAILSTVRLC